MTGIILSSSRIAALAAAALLFAPAADACGPDFPNRFLTRGIGAFALRSDSSLAKELARIPVADPGFRARNPDDLDYGRETAETDVADLRAALDERGIGRVRREAVVKAYREIARRRRTGEAVDPSTVPPEIPREFLLYLEGAAEWHAERSRDAGRKWAELLDLPEGERRWRSTWAAYMLARSRENSDREVAAKGYTQVRRLAADGFPDSLHLAAASLGRQALVCLYGDRYAEAIRLYLAHLAAGDPSAVVSLKFSAMAVIYADAYGEVAADPTARQVVTAYLLARGYPWSEAIADWSEALAAAGVREAAETDRLAYMAYSGGDLDGARRWLDLAPRTDLAEWVRSRFLLREGRIQDAGVILERLAGSFRDGGGFDPGTRIRSELATIRMAEGRYEEALALFLDAGDWMDASYVAERVLTPRELRDFVDRRPSGDGLGTRLKSLLARRLARRAFDEEPLRYFGPEEAERYRDLLDALRTAEDPIRPQEIRAAAGIEAARILRHDGLELIGTEQDPDWAMYGGDYDLDPFLAERGKDSDDRLAGASADERRRVEASAATPDKRWHYRYRAADLAFTAASLMPDEREETARVLIEAGGWLRKRDPKAADRFYKALVLRCGTTPQGRAAAALRWFPKASDR